MVCCLFMGVLKILTMLQGLSGTAALKDDGAYTALVGKTLRDHTALTTDKRLSGGEALKLSKPPLLVTVILLT